MTVPISRSATFAFTMSQRLDGYLVERSEVTDELEKAGLICTQAVGDGFVIARAIRPPIARQRLMQGPRKR